MLHECWRGARAPQRCAMYASSLRRAGTAATRPRHARRVRPLGSGRPRPLAQQKGHASRSASAAAAEAGGGSNGEAWASGRSKLAGWRKPSVAGAVALVPVVGGAWLVTVYALRQRLCEHHLQQVEGADSTASRERERRRRSRNSKDSGGSGGKAAFRTAHQPLYPGSSADAKALRDMLARPASGVTVLCVDPPASYTGDAFVRSALLGRAATVHVRAGEGYGSLPACLARGLGVEFMAIKLQMSALLSGLGGEGEWSGGGEGRGGPTALSSTSSRELADIRAALETATAALEEIRNQADDPRHHLPPVIIMDGLLGRIRAGEDVPAGVEAVLRWCWTVTGGRRLAHVVLIAPQSMAVDGSLVRVKSFLNDGRLAPGMMRVVALNAPDSKVAERRFRPRFTSAAQQQMAIAQEGDRDEGEGERAVALCMELVHQEGCAVAEEANEILRRTEFSDDKPGKLSASRLALDETLDDFALEAWRRVAAAVASTTAHTLTHPDAGGIEGLRRKGPVAVADDAVAGSGAVGSVDRPPFGSPSGPSSGPALAASPQDGEGGGGVFEGGEATAATTPAEEPQQQQHQQQQIGENKEPAAPGFRVDEHASLEATAERLRTDQRAALVARGDALGAPVAGAPEDVALAPVSPVGRLVRLLGELAGGGKVTLEHAVAALNGDGKALAVLLDLGVLRLCPRTLSSPVSPVRVDTATGRALPLPLSLTLSASPPQKLARNSTSTSPDVLGEAGAAFQVGAATPMMTGVFSILKGCVGVEEQAIAHALHFLRGGRPNHGGPNHGGKDGFSTELELEEERQAWQAHREASMAVLVQRAMSAPPPGQGQGGGEVRAAAERGRGRGGKGGKKSTSAYRSRRLQTALSAVGCMATWSEIYKELSAADAQGGLLADETFLPALLRAYQRAPPPPPETATSSTSVTAPGEAGQLQRQSRRSRGRVEERLEEAEGPSDDSGSDDDHARDETGGSPVAPVGHGDDEEGGKIKGLEHSASPDVGHETSAGLGINSTHDDAAREGEPVPGSEGESGATKEEGAATEGLSVGVVRQGSGGSGSGIGLDCDGEGGGGGGGGGGIEYEDVGAADTDCVAGAGNLPDTAPPVHHQQEEEDPETSENRIEGEAWWDSPGNYDPADGNEESAVWVSEPSRESGSVETGVSESSRDSDSVETGVAEESTAASEADEPEPAADTEQEETSPLASASSDSPSSEAAAAAAAAAREASEAAPAPSADDSSRDQDVPSKEEEDEHLSRYSNENSSNDTASTPPSSKEDEGAPPQAEEHVGDPDEEAATGSDHDDEDGSSSSSAGSNGGGGAPDPDLGAAPGGEEGGVDATANSEGGVPEGKNNIGSVLAAEKPLRERAASWTWMLPSWRSAGGKHY